MMIQTRPQPMMAAAMPTPCIWPSRFPLRSALSARSMPTDALTGIIRWAPMLQTVMKISMVVQFEPHTVRPTMPNPTSIADRAPIHVSGRKNSMPAMTTVRNPGSSRGNSRNPRASAPMVNVSLRKLLNVVSKMPPAAPRHSVPRRNNRNCGFMRRMRSMMAVNMGARS